MTAAAEFLVITVIIVAIMLGFFAGSGIGHKDLDDE